MGKKAKKELALFSSVDDCFLILAENIITDVGIQVGRRGGEGGGGGGGETKDKFSCNGRGSSLLKSSKQSCCVIS